MIFVNSMSDLFHKDIPRDFIDNVFDLMERADRHVYQLLTKRSSLMRDYLIGRYGDRPVPGHIWSGVSVEDRAHAGRIDHLKAVISPARFISFEPLLGPVGGKSGPGCPADQNTVTIRRAARKPGCDDQWQRR